MALNNVLPWQILLLLLETFCILSEGNISIVPFITTSTGISISWRIGSEQEIHLTSFNISATYVGPCTADRPQPLDFVVGRDRRTYSMTSLEEFSNYSISVSAMSNNSVISSNHIIVNTRMDSPAAPQNVRATLVTQTQVFLEWNDIPCLERNADIDHYVIENSNNRRTRLPSGTSQTTTYVASRLRPATEHVFRVNAIYYENQGLTMSGQTSKDLLITTEGVPEAPYATIVVIIANITVQEFTSTLQNDIRTDVAHVLNESCSIYPSQCGNLINGESIFSDHISISNIMDLSDKNEVSFFMGIHRNILLNSAILNVVEEVFHDLQLMVNVSILPDLLGAVTSESISEFLEPVTSESMPEEFGPVTSESMPVDLVVSSSIQDTTTKNDVLFLIQTNQSTGLPKVASILIIFGTIAFAVILLVIINAVACYFWWTCKKRKRPSSSFVNTPFEIIGDNSYDYAASNETLLERSENYQYAYIQRRTDNVEHRPGNQTNVTTAMPYQTLRHSQVAPDQQYETLRHVQNAPVQPYEMPLLSNRISNVPTNVQETTWTNAQPYETPLFSLSARQSTVESDRSLMQQCSTSVQSN